MRALWRTGTAGGKHSVRCLRESSRRPTRLQPDKLMQKMPQADSCFAAWYPRVKDQAKRCNRVGYDGSKAARDAILLQTHDRKL